MTAFDLKRALRVLLVAGLVASALIFAPSPVAQAQDNETKTETKPKTWYVTTVISGRAGFRVSHYWSSGPRVRVHTMLGVNPITTIVGLDRYWVYDALLGEGVEIKRSASAIADDPDRERPFGDDLDKLIQAGGERVGRESASGIPAEVWRLTNNSGRRTIWASEGPPQLPLRIENFDRDSGESVTLSYSNWASKFEIPTGFFEAPAGISLRKFEYEAYVSESLKGPVGPGLILFPELLHGPRPASSR